MADEWSKFVNDSRIKCKYGDKCYQKNPEHHKTYKHPPAAHENKIKHDRNKNSRMKPYQKPDRPANKITESQESELISPGDSTASTTEPLKTNINKDIYETDTRADNQETNKPRENTEVIIDQNTQFYDKTDSNKTYKDLFLVEMPQDFFQFYKCLSEEKSIDQLLKTVNLQLIGPYDLLTGKLPITENKDLYLIHWRFFYDPPEFQAVLKKKGKSEYHIGYYRDDPCSDPKFLASNDSAKDYHIQPLSDNIFGAVYSFLKNEKKSSPFLSMPCQKLMEKVSKWASEYNYTLDEYTMKMRSPVARTLHGAGIVVPFDKKTQIGYRPLAESNASLKKMFAKLESAKSQIEKDEVLSQIQPVITYASIAVDECDFGTGLELGINLFCSGIKELESSAASSLCSAYSLLNRDTFNKIVQAHLKNRRKGPDMSIFK
ncbi:histone PARylation factor 1-like [Battus philenor]|uniref:histone PARylation factor 1-like n=1 Tax=Battus philenor TaxID=42288 RepID=UPI0035CF483F